MGRFVNADGNLDTETGILSHNLYVYCNNDPIAGLDPLGDYNRNAAVKYALKWWNGRNKKYYSYSQDCTNFVSQVLYAGGIPMNETWYSQRSKLSNPTLLQRAKSIFSYKFKYLWYISPAWRLVYNNYSYFKSSKYVSGEVKITSSKDIKLLSENVRIGDIIYFDKGKGIYHVGIVSKIDNGIIYYAAHTSNRKYRDLSTFFSSNSNGKVTILLMK